MNFRQLNKRLLEVLQKQQLNEMAIYYGTNHGEIPTVVDAYKNLCLQRNGMYHIQQTLKVERIVTSSEITQGLFNPIQLGIPTIRNYPIIMVWGEPDVYRNKRKLEGHGLVHILQGHSNNLGIVFQKLNSCLLHGYSAKLDMYGNYTIRLDNFRFSFMLVDNEDGTPKHAVLITAYKR